MLRTTGGWDSGVYRSWLVSVRGHWAKIDVWNGNSKLEASVINTTLGQDSNWTQTNSDQRVGHQ